MNYVREISSLSYLGVLLNVPTTVFAYFMSRFEMYFPGLGFTKRDKQREFEFYVLANAFPQYYLWACLVDPYSLLVA